MSTQQNTFAYAPGVRIYIKSETKGTIDVSDDIVDYTVQRRSDGPSTANFSVQNVGRKYDGIFSPNDEIIIELKRVSWVRVFTGLLNSVPLITMWPRVVAFSASCSLKRLQYWYWDPELATSWMLATTAMANGRKQSDSGITNVILTLLRDVVGWKENKVHIGAIPPNWFNLVQPYAQQLADQLVASDAQVTEQWSTIASGSVGGASVDGSTTPSGAATPTTASGMFSSFVNKYSSSWPSLYALNNAEVIIRVGKNRGVSDEFIAGALAVSAGESSWNNTVPNSKGDGGLGLFQQGPGWGSTAQRTDPAESSRHFYAAFQSTPASAFVGQTPVWACMYVNDAWKNPKRRAQRQHLLAAHEKYFAFSQQLVTYYNTTTKGLGSVGNDSNSRAAGTAVTQGSGQRTLTYKDLAIQTTKLIKLNPGLPYGSQKNTITLADIKPEVNPAPNGRGGSRGLGCSQFTSWVILHLFGSLPNHWPLQAANAQHTWMVTHGGHDLSVAEARKTQGAFLFEKTAESGTGGHVAISDGQGGTWESRNPSSGGPQYNPGGASWGKYNKAALMPGIDYTNAVNDTTSPQVSSSGFVDTNSLSGIAAASNGVPYSSTPGFDSTNVFDQMFGGLIAPKDPYAELQGRLALAFSGPRALLNDQPLLPYIKNLVNGSMRSFCSAPNGDFMAWFPDYYGLWGTAGIMTIEPIELMDFYVEWTDDYFVTHQYTVAGTVNWFDGFKGEISTTFTPEPGSTPFDDARVVTAGIASIDIPALMYALFGINLTAEQGDQFAQYIYRKFGARPDFKEMDGMIGKTAEIFSAMYYFMRQWSYQYNANVPVTFMPELWPGMLIQVPEYDFQAYVTAVTHSGQMGEGGGHSTSINAAAPARLPDGSNTHHLLGLPLAGGMVATDANVVTRVNPGMSAQAQKNAKILGSSV